MHAVSRGRLLTGRRAGVALVLCLLVLLTHVHTLRAYFLGDDFDILLRISRQDSFLDVLNMTYAGNWGPLSYTQFYMDYRLGGLDPLPYHLTNLVWLCIAIVTLYGFVRIAWPEAPMAAWAAALLFAVHPVHDEALSYICARSHTIGTALALVALTLYAVFRLHPGSALRRRLVLTGSVAAAFFAALSKESALTLPAWIGAFEWLFVRSDQDPPRRSFLRAAGSVALFGAAVGLVPLVRLVVIGGAPPRLESASGEVGRFWAQIAEELPVYALYGAVPIPFSWMDVVALRPFRALGWAVAVAGAAIGLRCLYVNTMRSRRATKAAAAFALGLVIASVTILPVLYAELPLRRRYLFITSVGLVLMAAAALERLRVRSPLAARAVLAVVVLAGAIGLAQRNDLYRRSGDVSRSLFDAVRDGPNGATHHVVLITMPRFYGGDNASGAYLLHFTDVRNAMRLFGIRDPELSYALKCERADDYRADVRFASDTELVVTTTFRGRRAFEEARARDLEEDVRGDEAVATLVSADPESRRLTYRVVLSPDFWEDERRALFVYSDDRVSRVTRPTGMPLVSRALDAGGS